MQDKINLLKEQVHYLNDQNQSLKSDKETGLLIFSFHLSEQCHDISYFEVQIVFFVEGIPDLNAFCQIIISSSKKLMLESRIESIQTKFKRCHSNYQDKITIEKELDLCREELSDERNSKEQINQNLQNTEQNYLNLIKTVADENEKLKQSLQSATQNFEHLKDDKEVLQNHLNLEKIENDNLRHQFTTVEKSEKKLNKRLKSAQQSIHTLKDEKEVLQKQLNLLHLKIEQSRCQQLENIRDLAEYDLWHENFVNGEYVVAYEIDPGLHQTVQYMLPKVHL